jgi:hypothetical protein
MSFCLRMLPAAQFSRGLMPLHAQDSHVVPGAQESQQIPGPRTN